MGFSIRVVSLVLVVMQIQLTKAVSLDLCGIDLDFDLGNITSAQTILDEHSQNCGLALPVVSPLPATEYSPVRWANVFQKRQCYTCTGETGCVPQNSVCCGTGYCPQGDACCNARCMPLNGVCCGAGYCDQGTICCGAHCCEGGTICNAAQECVSSSSTVTTTTTAVATNFVTVTNVVTNVGVVTKTATAYVTFVTTALNVKTQTVIDSTVTVLQKRAWNLYRPTEVFKSTTATAPTSVTYAPRPTIQLGNSPRLDVVQRKLEGVGFMVKRTVTVVIITVTNVVHATNVVTVTKISTANVESTVTVTITVPVTVVSAVGAETTVHKVLTVTGTSTSKTAAAQTSAAQASASQTQSSPGAANGGADAVPTAQAQNSANTPSTGGLSTAAEAGIGAGTASGSLIICIILFFCCRRRRKPDPAAPQTTAELPEVVAAAESPQTKVVKSPAEMSVSPTAFPDPYTPYRVPTSPPPQGYTYVYPPPAGSHELSTSPTLSQTSQGLVHYQQPPSPPQFVEADGQQHQAPTYYQVRSMTPQEMAAVYSNSP